MARRREERPTKVYTRCESCGAIAKSNKDGALPDGWVLIEKLESRAPRAACSADCAQKMAVKQAT